MRHLLSRTGDGQPMMTDLIDGPPDRPTLILIHGWTCRRSNWAAQMAHLEGHFTTIAPDLPGHGETRAPDRRDWTLDSLASDICQLMRDIHSPQFQDTHDPGVILIGHSMGGAVALKVAQQQGSQVRGVILVDTFMIDYTELDEQARNALYKPFEKDLAASLAYMVKTRLGANTPHALRQLLLEQLPKIDGHIALPLWKSLLNWDAITTLQDLTNPIHSINGGFIPDAARRRVSEFSTEDVLSESGHFPHMEDPEKFNQLLDSKLKVWVPDYS